MVWRCTFCCFDNEKDLAPVCEMCGQLRPEGGDSAANVDSDPKGCVHAPAPPAGVKLSSLDPNDPLGGLLSDFEPKSLGSKEKPAPKARPKKQIIRPGEAGASSFSLPDFDKVTISDKISPKAGSETTKAEKEKAEPNSSSKPTLTVEEFRKSGNSRLGLANNTLFEGDLDQSLVSENTKNAIDALLAAPAPTKADAAESIFGSEEAPRRSSFEFDDLDKELMTKKREEDALGSLGIEDFQTKHDENVDDLFVGQVMAREGETDPSNSIFGSSKVKLMRDNTGAMAAMTAEEEHALKEQQKAAKESKILVQDNMLGTQGEKVLQKMEEVTRDTSTEPKSKVVLPSTAVGDDDLFNMVADSQKDKVGDASLFNFSEYIAEESKSGGGLFD